MDRGTLRAAVHGVARVGHELLTKPPPHVYKCRNIGQWIFPIQCVNSETYETGWKRKMTLNPISIRIIPKFSYSLHYSPTFPLSSRVYRPPHMVFQIEHF